MKTVLILLSVFLAFSYSLLSQKNIDTTALKQIVSEIEEKNTLIILGEAHEVAGTYGLEAFIIEEFAKLGYKKIIIESGVSEAILLNEYLNTGDEEILNNTRAVGANYRELIKSVREIKETYSELEFQGVDFERSICLEYVIQNYLHNIENQKLTWIIEKLENIKAKTSAKKVKKIILEVRADYHLYEEEFEKELKDRAELLKSIIFNPVYQADFGISSKKRDASIVENLIKINQEELKESILIFGSNHFTNPKHLWPNFSKQIEGKVECALFLFSYKNCTNFMKSKNYNSVKPLSIYVENSTIKESKIDFEEIRSEDFIQGNNKVIIVKMLNQ